jgi:hypothetical protein
MEEKSTMKRTDLTTYTIKTTLLDKERYGNLCYRVFMYFPYHHPMRLINDTELIIKIDLDYWGREPR